MHLCFTQVMGENEFTRWYTHCPNEECKKMMTNMLNTSMGVGYQIGDDSAQSYWVIPYAAYVMQVQRVCMFPKVCDNALTLFRRCACRPWISLLQYPPTISFSDSRFCLEVAMATPVSSGLGEDLWKDQFFPASQLLNRVCIYPVVCAAIVQLTSTFLP